jgi:hypothetical protein
MSIFPSEDADLFEPIESGYWLYSHVPFEKHIVTFKAKKKNNKKLAYYRSTQMTAAKRNYQTLQPRDHK